MDTLHSWIAANRQNSDDYQEEDQGFCDGWNAALDELEIYLLASQIAGRTFT